MCNANNDYEKQLHADLEFEIQKLISDDTKSNIELLKKIALGANPLEVGNAGAMFREIANIVILVTEIWQIEQQKQDCQAEDWEELETLEELTEQWQMPATSTNSPADPVKGKIFLQQIDLDSPDRYWMVTKLFNLTKPPLGTIYRREESIHQIIKSGLHVEIWPDNTHT